MSQNASTDVPDLAELDSWFAGDQTSIRSGGNTVAEVVSIEDAERLLTLVEAHLVLNGRSDLRAPEDVAACVAGLGLLGLALQLADAHGLDSWPSAFQPFTRLCVEAETYTDDKVATLVHAARGAAQSYMFVRSDAREPLGSGGRAREALWTTLGEALAAHNKEHSKFPTEKDPGLDAHSIRLYSLVVNEMLSMGFGKKLPDFVGTSFATGGQLGWVSLLRIFMKHSRTEDALDLLAEQLVRDQAHGMSMDVRPSFGTQTGATGCGISTRGFPINLVMQLKAALASSGASDAQSLSTDSSSSTARLDEVLAQFRRHLEEESSGLVPVH